MIGFTAFKILGDYQVGNWATAEDQYTRFGFYCGFTFGYSIITTGFIAFRTVVLLLFGWAATKKLHEDMLAKVLNAPINLYFEVTPIGRILNKFSKDLS